MNPVTVIAVGDQKEAPLEGLAHQQSRLLLVRCCSELAELLAACQSGLAQVAFVARCAQELTATLVDRLTAVGVAVVAVSDSPKDAQRLRGFGATPVAAQIDAATLIEVLCAAVEDRRHPGQSGYAVPATYADVQRRTEAHDEESASREQAWAPQNSTSGRAKNDRTVQREDTAAMSANVSQLGARDDGGPGDDPDQEVGSVATGSGLPARPHELADGVALQAGPGPSPKPTGWGAKIASALQSGGDRRCGSAWTVRKRAIKSTSHSTFSTFSAIGSESGTGIVSDTGQAIPGRIVAVWGPIGSPGRTTLAMNLAAEEAAAGRSVMLIDADSYGASIAASLGLLDESASFAQACRAADQGVLSRATLEKISSELVFAEGTFSLLTGLTRADRWPELRAAAVERVLSMAQKLSEVVVVDCGFALESDEELSYDTVAPRRNAATLTVLTHADVIYAVGNSDPVGIPRLIKGLSELSQIVPDTQVHVVANKVRRKAVGGSPEKALAQAWERFGPVQGISHFLPWDPELTDKALLEGRLLLEVAPDAALRRAIRNISCAADQRKPKVAVAKATAKL